jgi:hypothetical protein
MIPSSSSLSPPQSLVLYYHETWKQSISALHHFMKSKQEIGNPPQQAQSQSVCLCLSWSCSSRLTTTVDLTRSRSKPQSSEQHFIINPPTTRPTIIFLSPAPRVLLHCRTTRSLTRLQKFCSLLWSKLHLFFFFRDQKKEKRKTEKSATPLVPKKQAHLHQQQQPMKMHFSS